MSPKKPIQFPFTNYDQVYGALGMPEEQTVERDTAVPGQRRLPDEAAQNLILGT